MSGVEALGLIVTIFKAFGQIRTAVEEVKILPELAHRLKNRTLVFEGRLTDLRNKNNPDELAHMTIPLTEFLSTTQDVHQYMTVLSEKAAWQKLLHHGSLMREYQRLNQRLDQCRDDLQFQIVADLRVDIESQAYEDDLRGLLELCLKAQTRHIASMLQQTVRDMVQGLHRMGQHSGSALGRAEFVLQQEPSSDRREWRLAFEKERKEENEKLEINHSDIAVFEKIGEGSFGEVYRGRYRSTDVAIKKLRRGKKDNLVDERAILDEVRTQSKCGSFKHVAYMYGFSRNDESDMFAVMELAPYGSLSDLLNNVTGKDGTLYCPGKTVQRATCSVRAVLTILYEISLGMEYLHSRCIMHRDIKTRNVLLGESLVPKLSDLGLAKEMTGESTRSMTAVGTPFYMAPEVLKALFSDHGVDDDSSGADKSEAWTSAARYTYTADVYSFGAVMTELCQRLYGGKAKGKILKGGSLPEAFPPRLTEIKKRCLQKRGRSRYGRGSDDGALVSDALLEVLDTVGGSCRLDCLSGGSSEIEQLCSFALLENNTAALGMPLAPASQATATTAATSGTGKTHQCYMTEAHLQPEPELRYVDTEAPNKAHEGTLPVPYSPSEIPTKHDDCGKSSEGFGTDENTAANHNKLCRWFVLGVALLLIVAIPVGTVLGMKGRESETSYAEVGGSNPSQTSTDNNEDKQEVASWSQLGQDLDGEVAENGFGGTVALSADGMVVAAGGYLNDGNGEDSGHVRVFQFEESTNKWVQLGQDLDGEAAGDRLGQAVALSSNGIIFASGAPFNTNGNGEYSGHVRVFQFDESTNNWIQLGQDLDGEAAYDRFGHSVALSSDGMIVAAGAVENDGNGDESGHVRVFQFVESTNKWVQLGQDLDGEAAGDQFGRAVALSSDGMIVAAGAHLNDENGENSGHVRVFQFVESTNKWVLLGQDLDGEAAGDQFGRAVALSSDGMVVAAGAIWNDGNGDNSGHVRVFQFEESTNKWVQLGQDLDGETTYDLFGFSVALSSDGMIVAVGASGNDGNTGFVRVFQFEESTNKWIQLGQDLDGEAAGDAFGAAVTLSSDGMIMAAGADYNNGNGEYSGHMRVFQFEESSN